MSDTEEWDGMWNIGEVIFDEKGRPLKHKLVPCTEPHEEEMGPHKLVLLDFKTAFAYALGMNHMAAVSEKRTRAVKTDRYFPIPSNPRVRKSKELERQMKEAMTVHSTTPSDEDFGGMYG